SPEGLYTAPASIVTPQKVTVTATSVADSILFGSAAVTLVPAVSVSVSPSSATLMGGQAQQFTAAVTNAANTAVTWSLNPNVGTITGSGLYTAPATIGVGQTVTVTATSVADGTKTATATVTLSTVVLTSLALGKTATQSSTF